MDKDHKRILTSDLLVIERRLRQIGQDLQQTGQAADSVLQSTINDIDPETRTKMLDTAKSMLGEIILINELFNLEVAHESLRWHIIAT